MLTKVLTSHDQLEQN